MAIRSPDDLRRERRALLRLGLTGAALAALPHPLYAATRGLARPERPYLDAALRAARWIHAARIDTSHGVTWPADPLDPKTVSRDLYAGAAGVVLFQLELYEQTRDPSHLAEACAAADDLVAAVDGGEIATSGLYDGLAGVMFVVAETYRAALEPKYWRAVERCRDLLARRARRAGRGIEWNDSADVISGGAGIGLALLDLHRRFGDRTCAELARGAAERLVELGRPDGDGVRWMLSPQVDREYPNFSHGTAGVGYFLATAYAATHDTAFMDAALRGAIYLKRIAKAEGDRCLVFHHTKGGEDRYYLGWCHGPAGTARLFHRLGQVTGDREWRAWVERAARGVLASGIPEQRTAGFWNNVSQCCGNAGVADFFVELHRGYRDEAALPFARRVVDDLLRRATDDAAGMRWVQAEDRVRPELRVAQTGYMQGAAGIGTLLLKLDAVDRGGRLRVVLPDSPYRGGLVTA
ncbi:MAG: lantibiotic modifying-like protein [Gemmatimonadota bacterium]|nr:lantibiotic modifying-like protein [Gemmatimonadota bacterium]